MMESQAREKAEKARAGAGVPGGFSLEWVKRRYIELAEARADGKYLVRDCLVWIAYFSQGVSFWELAIDDKTSRVVRSQRSR